MNASAMFEPTVSHRLHRGRCRDKALSFMIQLFNGAKNPSTGTVIYTYRYRLAAPMEVDVAVAPTKNYELCLCKTWNTSSAFLSLRLNRPRDFVKGPR
jgi:hypothetical protein